MPRVTPGRALVRTGWLVLLALCPGIARGDADPGLSRLARAAGQNGPLMRIGLAAASRLQVESTGSYRVIDPSSGDAVWRESFDEPLQLLVDGVPRDGVGVVYRLQIGAFEDRSTAEAERKRLEGLTGASGVVRADPDRGTWRVRLGRAEDRLALGPLGDRLRAVGQGDFWIAEEPASELSEVRIRLVDAAFESRVTQLRRLAVVPVGKALVMVAGRPYRGVVEFRVRGTGTLQPVNWIELETYLRGVVPEELGPEVWPQLEALKAQAVAARTYAWRNRGQFGDEGFDICDSPRCQVYGGQASEHPLSDRAIAVTRGQVLRYGGEPIAALYTATCGGHTEDGGLVFADHDRPYLRGVPCRAEGEALASLRRRLPGRSQAPVIDETGADVTRDWALLEAAGVLQAEGNGTLTPQGLRGHTSVLARLSGLPGPAGPPGPVEDLGLAVETLLRDLGWQQRAGLLLAEADLPALLRDPTAQARPASQSRALAYLAWVEALRPFPDGSFGVDRRPSAARLAPALARIGTAYRAFGLSEGTVAAPGADSVRLIQGMGEVRLPLAPGAFLFARTAGRPVPSASLEIWPGDRVRFRTDSRGAIDFLEQLPPVKGTSDDRTAAVYSWEVRRTRRELEASINRRVQIGRLTGLRVLRRGVSGRVAELEVTGSRAATTVRGFDVRRLLGLRESLAVMEIQRSGDGAIEAVVFAGKGWGHGVGMCQVGAYGMALRGARHDQILAHYYRGAELHRIED